jgi:hypothetical protein
MNSVNGGYQDEYLDISKRGSLGATIRPGRVRGADRGGGLVRAGQGVEKRVGVPQAFLHEHHQRILTHQIRVAEEMRKLGLSQGDSLVVCKCGAETSDGVKLRLREGWAESPGGWICRRCAGGD